MKDKKQKSKSKSKPKVGCGTASMARELIRSACQQLPKMRSQHSGGMMKAAQNWWYGKKENNDIRANDDAYNHLEQDAQGKSIDSVPASSNGSSAPNNEFASQYDRIQAGRIADLRAQLEEAKKAFGVDADEKIGKLTQALEQILHETPETDDEGFLGGIPETKSKSASGSAALSSSILNTTTGRSQVTPAGKGIIRNGLLRQRYQRTSGTTCDVPNEIEQQLATHFNKYSHEIDRLYATLMRSMSVSASGNGRRNHGYAEQFYSAIDQLNDQYRQLRTLISQSTNARLKDLQVPAENASKELPTADVAWQLCASAKDGQTWPSWLPLQCLKDGQDTEERAMIITQLFPLYMLRERALQALVELHNHTHEQLRGLLNTSRGMQQLEYEAIPPCRLRDHCVVLWNALSYDAQRKFESAKPNMLKAVEDMQSLPDLSADEKARWRQGLDGLHVVRWWYEREQWEEMVESYTQLVRVYVSIRPVVGFKASPPPPVNYNWAANKAPKSWLHFSVAPELRDILIGRQQARMEQHGSQAAGLTGTVPLSAPERWFGPFQDMDEFDDYVIKLKGNNAPGVKVLLVTYGFSGSGKSTRVRGFMTKPHVNQYDPDPASYNDWLEHDRTYFYQNTPPVEVPWPGGNGRHNSNANGRNGRTGANAAVANWPLPPAQMKLFIRPTPNNPTSSRAFTFIKLHTANLTVLDMAGHEDPLWFVTQMLPTLNYDLWQHRLAQAGGDSSKAPIANSDRLFMMFDWIHNSTKGSEGRAYDVPAAYVPSNTNKNPRAYRISALVDNEWAELSENNINTLFNRLIVFAGSSYNAYPTAIQAMGVFACHIILESLSVVQKAVTPGLDDRLTPDDYLQQFEKGSNKSGDKVRLYKQAYDGPDAALFKDVGNALEKLDGMIKTYMVYVYARHAILHLLQYGKHAKTKAIRTACEEEGLYTTFPTIHTALQDMYKLQVIFENDKDGLGSRSIVNYRLGLVPVKKGEQKMGVKIEDGDTFIRAYIGMDNKSTRVVQRLTLDQVSKTINAVKDPELVERVQQQLFLAYSQDRASVPVRVYSYYLKIVDLMMRQGGEGRGKDFPHDKMILTPWTDTVEMPKDIKDATTAFKTYVLSCVRPDIKQGDEEPKTNIYTAEEVSRLVEEAHFISKVNSNIQLYLQKRELRPNEQDRDPITNYIDEQKYTKILMLANIRNDHILSQQVGAYETLDYVQAIKST